MQGRIAVTILFIFGTFIARATDEPAVFASEVKTVTVYRSGAELSHRAVAQLHQGAQDIIIEGISNNIDINSVQINCPVAVTIMGVTFSNNFLVAPESTARIKFLQDSAALVQKDLDRINVQVQTTKDLLDVLKLNRDIKGQQNGVSVAELIKLMDYYKIKSAELQSELATQKEKQQKISELLAKITNQIKEEQSRNTRTAGRLRLQLSVAVSGRYDFTVTYITPNAWWTPSYDIRVDDIKNPMKIIYKAKVAQTTGIDWKKIRLSLSTSVPGQWGNAPMLKSWFLSYINPVVVMEKTFATNRLKGPGENDEISSALTGSVAGVQIRGAATLNADNAPLYIVNGVPMNAQEFSKIGATDIKSVEVLKDASATAIYGARALNGVVLVTLKEGFSDYVSVSDNELDVTFDIDLPYDVQSNGKEQTATLKEYDVASNYKYYSVPRLDKDAYLIAGISEWGKLNLLPGEANIIFEGTYVGKSFIDPASTSDTLSLTLGRDKRVVIKKEKLADYSSIKFLGTNKLQKMTYEITVKNNKKDTVRMLLKEQYPISTNKEVEVELLDNGGAVNDPEIGVLAWNLELAPGETRKLRFAYSVKYPKDKLLNLN